MHKHTPHTHTQAIANAGYTGKIKIGMDVAASEFYQVITLNLKPKPEPNPNMNPF